MKDGSFLPQPRRVLPSSSNEEDLARGGIQTTRLARIRTRTDRYLDLPYVLPIATNETPIRLVVSCFQHEDGRNPRFDTTGSPPAERGADYTRREYIRTDRNRTEQIIEEQNRTE